MMLVASFMKRLIRRGQLTVIDAAGKPHTFKGQEPLHEVTIRFTDRKLERDILLNPRLAVLEAYVDGRLLIEQGDLHDFLDLCVVNLEAGMPASGSVIRDRLAYMTRRLRQWHPPRRAKANVAHHYDLSGKLYELFLDTERQYSCAYFENGSEDIETAQRAKERHIAAKLLLEPGQKVLDIGCGWGGLAFHLAREHQVDVTGITLSEEQHAFASERARQLGLTGQVRFRLEDFRATRGSFDRIVSVGMMEHVGVNHFATMFRTISELLTDDGIALVHCIGRRDGPSFNHPWIDKYIFPGGYIPALSEIVPAIERQHIWLTDLEVLRLHYAYTLQRWRARFLAKWEEARALYGERFCRMWDVYLVASELFFTRQEGFVFQVQLAKDRYAVPLTRDYIHSWEQGHAMPQARAAE